ncbi:hypothetical protein C0995_013425 [Termitomyces sp. Mi166|nr:hypothetical protein C0995_013425 [Termitomyces sp. Mi166\
MAYILLDNSNRLTGSPDIWNGAGVLYDGTGAGLKSDIGVTFSFSGAVMENEGVAAAFYGIKERDSLDPIPTLGTILVDGKAYNAPDRKQFTSPYFSTPTLPDGQHDVTFKGDFPLILDYAVVTASNTTSLSGERLIVDDGDASLTYSGNWIRNNSGVWIDDSFSLPSGGAVHQTQDPMASLTFTFSGTSVSVYGIFDEQLPALYSIFTLDGKDDTVNSYEPPPGTSMNVLWYACDSLVPGNHTLSILFNSTSSGYFALDFITYIPSFPSLAALQGNPTNVVSSSTPSPTAEPSPNPSSTMGSSGSSKSHMAVLIGAPVGGVVGILLLACLLFLLRKKIFPGLAASGKKPQPTTLIEPEDLPSVVPAPAAASLVNPFDEPYREIPDNRSIAPSSSGPRSVTTATREGDMVQVPPPEKPLAKSSGRQASLFATASTSAGAGPSTSVEVKTHGTDGMDASRTEEIQGLVDKLQQAIAAGGIVVTPESDGASPPPYELPGKRAPS